MSLRNFQTSSATVQLLDKKPWKAWKGHRTARKKNGDDNGKIEKNLIEVDFSIYNPDDYLLSWATAVSGVEPEDYDGHTIVSPHSKWLNDNGNAWLNQVLLESYNSFIMAENYLEHIQIPSLSKGKILDAVAWVVEQQINGYSEVIPTLFVDILVATHKKKHPKLCKNILSKRINTMSMGCALTHYQCSKCGKVFRENIDEPCKHIESNLGKTYKTPDGKSHRIAELCGVPGIKNSNIFEECSWVLKPAFHWAKRHGDINFSPISTGRPLKAFVPEDRVFSDEEN